MCRSPNSLPPHLLPASPPRMAQTKAGVPGKGAAVAAPPPSAAANPAVSTCSTSVCSPTRSESPVDFLSKVKGSLLAWRRQMFFGDTFFVFLYVQGQKDSRSLPCVSTDWMGKGTLVWTTALPFPPTLEKKILVGSGQTEKKKWFWMWLKKMGHNICFSSDEFLRRALGGWNLPLWLWLPSNSKYHFAANEKTTVSLHRFFFFI